MPLFLPLSFQVSPSYPYSLASLLSRLSKNSWSTAMAGFETQGTVADTQVVYSRFSSLHSIPAHTANPRTVRPNSSQTSTSTFACSPTKPQPLPGWSSKHPKHPNSIFINFELSQPAHPQYTPFEPSSSSRRRRLSHDEPTFSAIKKTATQA